MKYTLCFSVKNDADDIFGEEDNFIDFNFIVAKDAIIVITASDRVAMCLATKLPPSSVQFMSRDPYACQIQRPPPSPQPQQF